MADRPASNQRVDYFMQPDPEYQNLVDLKNKCASLLGDIYALINLRKTDPRGEAEFKGKLLNLFRLLEGKMIKSDIMDFYEEPGPDGQMVKKEYLKYQELAKAVNYEFIHGIDMKKGEKILQRIFEFIEESGILLKNQARYV